MYFVPELLGAVTFDATLTNRFDGLVDGYDFGLPPLGGDFAMGWRQYLEGWGQAALGANLGLGFQASGDDREPLVLHPRVELTGRLRGLSPEFFSFGIGVYAQVGPVYLDGGQPPDEFPELAGASSGWSWAVGVETGPGKLVNLAPYVFGELSARIGFEVIRLRGLEVHTVTGGLRLGFDWAFLDPTPSDPPEEPRATPPD